MIKMARWGAALLGLALLSTACGSDDPPAPFSMHGNVIVPEYSTGHPQAPGCRGSGPFDDVKPAARVAILDAQGVTVGEGWVGVGEVVNDGLGGAPSCELDFEAAEIPGGLSEYRVKIADRAPVAVAGSDARADVDITLA